MTFNTTFEMTDAELLWVRKEASSYGKLEEELNFPSEIGAILQQVDPSLKESFELSENSFYQFKKRELDTYSGTAMRNVLEAFKGRLFATAMQPNEQKIDWETMVDRLSLFLKGTLEYELLLRQGNNWKLIHKNLSDLLKNRPTNEYSIDQAHINLISHMYAVLSLIRLE